MSGINDDWQLEENPFMAAAALLLSRVYRQYKLYWGVPFYRCRFDVSVSVGMYRT